MTPQEIKKDFLAFADDDSDVIFDSDTDELMYYKNGEVHHCKLTKSSSKAIMIEYQGESFPYDMFIAKHLARLDLFAKKLIEKRIGVAAFVDSPAILRTANKEIPGSALSLLEQQCDAINTFGSTVNFITADAGHGKSALLKQFQYLQAKKYREGKANYIFWHVDLQGRDLVRLGEAIMYDLGELRLPGLYYPSIINLIQKRLIILAIDGFDELAAEIGGMNDAVSSLSNLVNEMEGQGTLIAASRRTFFNTDDYLKRATLLKNKNLDIRFNELKLKDWSKDEVITYFENLEIQNPEKIYNCIVDELHDENHPILTRPFLLSKLAEAIQINPEIVSTFFSKSVKKEEGGVAMIVEAFTQREVTKWKTWDKETGKAYLTSEQHIRFLSEVAKAMWESKRDFISLEEMEIYIASLLEGWKIELSLKPSILQMVRTHAFLNRVSESKNDYRKFDHEEFKNYFIARALAELIDKSILTGNTSALNQFLYIDQLPDSVAMYCFHYIPDLNKKVNLIIEAFRKMIAAEYKPTYLQMNIGTLFPFLIDNIEFVTPIHFDAKVNFTSLVFESKSLKNITFENSEFMNISLRNTTLTNVHFVNCRFNEMKIETNSKVELNNVSFDKYEVISISLLKDGEAYEVAYSPTRIKELIIKSGIKIIDNEALQDLKTEEPSIKNVEFKKTVTKFLLKFRKETIQYQRNIEEDKYITGNSDLVIHEIVPLLEKYKIIEDVENNHTRQAKSRAWRLRIQIEDLLRFDGIESTNTLSNFWKEVNEKE
jgi:hypothetical protein